MLSIKSAYNYQVVTGIIALLWSAGSSTGEHNERQVLAILRVATWIVLLSRIRLGWKICHTRAARRDKQK